MESLVNMLYPKTDLDGQVKGTVQITFMAQCTNMAGVLIGFGNDNSALKLISYNEAFEVIKNNKEKENE